MKILLEELTNRFSVYYAPQLKISPTGVPKFIFLDIPIIKFHRF
jgi:hypothetical protein